MIVDPGFFYLARYPLLVLTGFSELLIPINKRLTSKHLKSLKLQQSLLSIIHLLISLQSMSSARIKIKTARDLLTASVWGRCGGKHTLFEIALPCIVNAGGFRVRFWRFYYWKTAVHAWCCFLVCQDYSCRSGATATVTSQWYVFLPNEMCFHDPGTHITRDMCSGEHMSRAKEPLLSRGLETVRRYFV